MFILSYVRFEVPTVNKHAKILLDDQPWQCLTKTNVSGISLFSIWTLKIQTFSSKLTWMIVQENVTTI
jgi:hypothetical protein